METAQPPISCAPPKRGAVCAYVRTVVTTTTVSDSGGNNEDRLTQIVAQLQKTRLNFSKLSQLQRRRVRNMQKLIRKKNGVIANLAARLNTRKRTKHFAVTIRKNVIHTTSGSEQFVRRRVSELCANGGEQVFCARRADCARDRRRVAKALATALGAGVVASAANKRFEIEDTEKLVSAKLIVQQVLHDGNHSDTCAD